MITTVQLLNPYYFLLIFDYAIWKFQIWRFVTTFLFAGPIKFNLLFYIMFLNTSVSKAENIFIAAGKQVDFYFMIFFTCVSNIMLGYVFDNAYALLDAFAFSLVYVQAKYLPDEGVMILWWRFRNANTPWV